MVQTVQNVVTWLKSWFYEKSEVYAKSETYSKSEVNSQLANKLNSNLTTANKMLVTDSNGNVVLDNLPSFNAIEVVETLPSASSSTMGKLYIINENSQVNVYYTQNNNGTYSWHEMDTDILDDLSIDWNDVQNKPPTFTPASHTHGNISNDGKIGTSANKIITTGTGGVLQASSSIPVARLSDSNAHVNIGTSANTLQSAINTGIDTALSNKENKGNCITSIELIPKSTDSTGAIKLYYGDEPTS